MKTYRAEIHGFGYVDVEADDEIQADLKAGAVDSSKVNWLTIEVGNELPREIVPYV